MRHARSYAREEAIKGLYLMRFEPNQDIKLKIKDKIAIKIINEIKNNEEQINLCITKKLKKWSILELNPVVLAILQVGTYELLQKELDKKIIISDCVNISNEYLEKKESNFVHFVLDNISKDLDV